MAPARKRRQFDAQSFLESAGFAKQVVSYARKEVVVSQGDPCNNVFYRRSGALPLRVLPRAGEGAVLPTLGPGDFLGEGALSGQPVRLETATATVATIAIVVP